MSLLLLDTTVLIDTERGSAVANVIGDEDDVAIGAVTVAELLVGVRLSMGRRRASRQAFVADLVESVPILPYDTGVAVEHAELLAVVRAQGRLRGAHDLIIAAIARATDRTVVTADRNAFDDLPGVSVLAYR